MADYKKLSDGERLNLVQNAILNKVNMLLDMVPGYRGYRRGVENAIGMAQGQPNRYSVNEYVKDLGYSMVPFYGAYDDAVNGRPQDWKSNLLEAALIGLPIPANKFKQVRMNNGRTIKVADELPEIDIETTRKLNDIGNTLPEEFSYPGFGEAIPLREDYPFIDTYRRDYHPYFEVQEAVDTDIPATFGREERTRLLNELLDEGQVNLPPGYTREDFLQPGYLTDAEYDNLINNYLSLANTAKVNSYIGHTPREGIKQYTAADLANEINANPFNYNRSISNVINPEETYLSEIPDNIRGIGIYDISTISPERYQELISNQLNKRNILETKLKEGKYLVSKEDFDKILNNMEFPAYGDISKAAVKGYVNDIKKQVKYSGLDLPEELVYDLNNKLDNWAELYSSAPTDEARRQLYKDLNNMMDRYLNFYQQ